MSNPIGLNFKDGEKLNLVNFMKTLADDNYLMIGKWSNPFIEEESTAVQGSHLFEDITVFPNPAIEFTGWNLSDSDSGRRDTKSNQISD